MVNEFSGNGFNTPRGSLRSLRIPSPVLAMVAVTLKFSNPLISTFEVDVPTVKLGTAATAATYMMRKTRGVQRGVESINMIKVPQAVGEAI